MSFQSGIEIRRAYITGLRALADCLASNITVAIPPHGTEILLHATSADDGGRTQVDHFARQLGIPVQDSLAYSGHYEAVCPFGPVSYRMVAISTVATARYHAADSCYGYVTPDTWT